MWGETTQAFPVAAVAPDLFELGESVQAWAAAALDQMGSEELIVIGCSVGGSCALEVARASPQQVAAIVLVGAKAEVNPDPLQRDEAVRLLETEGMSAAWKRYWLPLFAENTSMLIKESARLWAMEQDVSTIVNGLRAFHDRRDLTSFAATWDRPLIGISGDYDVAPSPSKTRRLATGPNRAFHLVADCGHYVSLEQPEAFGALLADTVRSVVRAP